MLAGMSSGLKVLFGFLDSWDSIGLPLLFCVVGLVLALFGYQNLSYAEQSTEWPTTEGTVVYSDTTSHLNQNQGKRSYSADVRYEYEVAGTEYTSSNISFQHETSGSHRDEIQAIVARYPKGKRVTVYYKPERPKTAVLEPGADSPSYGMLIVGGGFLLLAVPLFLLALVNKARTLAGRRGSAPRA